MSKSSRTFNPSRYLQEVVAELKNVTWPSKEQTTQKTLLVIGATAAIGAYLGGIDYVFTQLIKLLLGN